MHTSVISTLHYYTVLGPGIIIDTLVQIPASCVQSKGSRAGYWLHLLFFKRPLSIIPVLEKLRSGHPNSSDHCATLHHIFYISLSWKMGWPKFPIFPPLPWGYQISCRRNAPGSCTISAVLDEVMRYLLYSYNVFCPIPSWPILKWNHMYLIHINQNWYPVILLIATNEMDPHLGHEFQSNSNGRKIFPLLFGFNSFVPDWSVRNSFCWGSVPLSGKCIIHILCWNTEQLHAIWCTIVTCHRLVNFLLHLHEKYIISWRQV